MAYDAKTERLIALKKLAGKAQTSNDKGLANEGLPSGITSTSETIFGETITTAPSAASLYTITGKVEYIRFTSTFIAGSDTSDGRHGFELKLPSDYETNSSNAKRGTYPFINSQTINITSGALQLVPPSFAIPYEVKPYYGGSGVKDSGTQIPLLDNRDWYFDYFNGIFFQQDPSGTGDQADNPDYVEGYLYIGNMLDTVVASSGGSGGGDGAAQYLVLAATGSLSAERVLTTGIGIDSADAGAGSTFTISADNSIVATLTGSVFSGNVVVQAGLSGSLQQLSNGTSYLREGTNVTIASSSDGSITISSAAGTGGGDVAAEYLVLSATGSLSAERVLTTGTGLSSIDSGAGAAYTISVNNSIVATLTGSVFSGNIVAQTGLSGSLQQLSNGTSYLREGSNVSISSSSDGYITISSTGGGGGGGDSFFSSPSPGYLNTTGSITFAGGLGTSYIASSVGSDTYFFVSGSSNSRGTSIRGSSVFGGDLISSGNIVSLSGMSGSIQLLSDGSTPYIIGAGSVNVTTASSGQLIVSSSAGNRRKDVYFQVSDVTAGSAVNVSNSDFSRVSYNSSLIDVLLNGQMLHSGSSVQVGNAQRDYYVDTSTSLKFAFDIMIDDVIDIIVYNIQE